MQCFQLGLFVCCVVPDPFNYITFFGLRKHEEMCGKPVCMAFSVHVFIFLFFINQFLTVLPVKIVVILSSDMMLPDWWKLTRSINKY